MKESEKIYQIKEFIIDGKKVEKAVCINNDEQLKKDDLDLLNKYSEHHFDELPEVKASNFDVITVAINEIKKSEYKPSYIKYHDGEKWVEITNFD